MLNPDISTACLLVQPCRFAHYYPPLFTFISLFPSAGLPILWILKSRGISFFGCLIYWFCSIWSWRGHTFLVFIGLWRYEFSKFGWFSKNPIFLNISKHLFGRENIFTVQEILLTVNSLIVIAGKFVKDGSQQAEAFVLTHLNGIQWFLMLSVTTVLFPAMEESMYVVYGRRC